MIALQYHSYKMISRPLDIGCQPTGHVLYIQADKGKDGYHGIVTYARMLTEEELKRYELEYLSE